MQFLIVICAAFAVAAARPSATLLTTAPIGTAFYTASAAPLLSQYHSQDELGQYAYGYNGLTSAKTETKTLDGITRGSYSYFDAEGKLQTVQYTADSANGFRVAATNLPQAPVDTAIAPLPVEDTPEVTLARTAHFKAVKEVEDRIESAPAPAAPELKTITPIALTHAPLIAFKTLEGPTSFSYSYSAPAYAYHVGTPYVASYPILPAAPAAAVIAARSLPVEVNVPQAPADTVEVAKARAEHLALVAEENARIQSSQ